MPNSLTATGLTTATQSELLAQLTAQFQALYGASINLSSSTPDGQMLLNFIQVILDTQDLLTTIYNFMDPDQAIGVVLDQRCAINGVIRNQGTYTQTNLTVTTNQPVNLYGLDQSVQLVFTYADAAGNQWELVTTQIALPVGVNILLFQAANTGPIVSVPNTITVPVTVVLGVVSVNNPTTYSVLGAAEESDAQLKIRRRQSVALPSQGYLQGLIAALENIPGVTSATVYENDTSAFDGVSEDAAYPLGTPPHSIWVVVAGTGSAAAIANAIYTKRNAGCGMRGESSQTVVQVDGSSFVILYDVVASQNLFIALTTQSINGVTPPQLAAIRAQLPTLLIPGVAQEVNVNEITTLVQDIDPNTLVTIAGVGLTSTTATNPILSPSSKKNQFAITSANIILLPMLMQPAIATVTHGNSLQLTALGGFGAYTWSVPTNASGGSVSGSGLYTAGATHPATDVVQAQDTLGNVVQITITVT